MSLKKTVSLGITGGIGSGKSHICRLLAQRGIPVFDTDTEARREMLRNTAIHARLHALLQAPPLLPDGRLDKPLLSAYIRSGIPQARKVGSIVHPYVRLRFRQWAEAQDAPIVVMESALLFEAHFNTEVTATLCVTAPLELRIRRIMERDGKSRGEALGWISLQTDEARLALKADHIIVNDQATPLVPQIDALLASLQQTARQQH